MDCELLRRTVWRDSHFAALTVALLLFAPAAQAAVTISSGATQNMTCSNGTCAPTAKSAVLNVSDLEGFLASGSVTLRAPGKACRRRTFTSSPL
jgi:hypothetical protein